MRKRYESIEHIAEITHAGVLDTIEGDISTAQGNIVMRGCAQTLRAAELQARYGSGKTRKGLFQKLIGPGPR